ncbi:hypothetical protein BD310DRAFT_981593, partial [Dichomitus squalens]
MPKTAAAKPKAAKRKAQPATPAAAKAPRGNHALFVGELLDATPARKRKPPPADDIAPAKKSRAGDRESDINGARIQGAQPRVDPDRRQADRQEPGTSTSGQVYAERRAVASPSMLPPSSAQQSSDLTSQSSPVTSRGGASSSRATVARPSGRQVAPAVPSTVARTVRQVNNFDQQNVDEDDTELEEQERPRKVRPRDWHAALGFDDDESEKADEEEDNESETEQGDIGEDDQQEHDDHGGFTVRDFDDAEDVSRPDVTEFIAYIKLNKKARNARNPARLVPHFTKWGRHCHRLVGAYTDVSKVIVCGLTVLKADPQTPEGYDACYAAMPNMSAATAKFYTKKYFYLCDKIPKFVLVSGHLLSSAASVFAFAKFMRIHASAGRSSDIASMRRSLTSYMPTIVYPSGRTILPLTKAQYNNIKRRNTGYYSHSTARLVIPIDERDAFDNARDLNLYCKRKALEYKNYVQGTYQQSKKSKGKSTSIVPFKDEESFPSFLFPTYQEYDPSRAHHAIFKGEFVLDMTRHLWKGPSSVGRDPGEPGRGRACLAQIYHVTKMTPALIAYTATLVRFVLGTEERWSGDDCQRSGHRFHIALHQLLSDEYEAWEEDVEEGKLLCGLDKNVDNIISYFNRCLLGSEYGHADEQTPVFWDVGVTEDGKDTLRSQMINARRAELDALRQECMNAVQSTSSDSREPSRSRSPSIFMIEAIPASSPAPS